MIRKQKIDRDYEIYPGIGYKFRGKSLTLKERHPMNKDRFEKAKNEIESFANKNGTELEDMDQEL